MQASIIGRAVCEKGPAQCSTAAKPLRYSAICAGCCRLNDTAGQVELVGQPLDGFVISPGQRGLQARSTARRAISRPV